MDRKTLRLDDWQDAMVQTVAAANKKTIVVARCSGAFLMPWLDDVKAVLYQVGQDRPAPPIPSMPPKCGMRYFHV